MIGENVGNMCDVPPLPVFNHPACDGWVMIGGKEEDA
jgi:hypothetical protein